MTAKDLVAEATTALFIDKDLTAIDRFFGPTYVQHSALAEDGVEGLRTLASHMPAEFNYTPIRILSDGELVVTHAIYGGIGPDDLVAFDIWRVRNDRIVEHWDSLTPVVAQTASVRTQTDGPVEPTDLDLTERNRAIVTEWAEKVLIGGDYSVLTDYISTETYDQHNPEVADGLDGFGAAAATWVAEGKLLAYKKVRQLIADGNFVFTRSEGEFGGPVAYNDLWRLADGKIVEHWDVVSPVPAELPHGNSVF